MYHYTESGLDYVLLINGYKKHTTPYGESVSIDAVEELHKEIGRSIVRSASKITPAEMRFLRVEMDLSQKSLGLLVGMDAQSIARWEKSECDINSAAERLLKGLYLNFIDKDSNISEICNRLAELDQQEPISERKFEDVNGEWKVAA